MRSKLLVTVVAALALGVGTSSDALSSSASSSSGNDHNVQLSRWGGSSVSFFSFSWGGNGYHEYLETLLNRASGLGIDFWGKGYGKKPPRDAGYVPEPGAVGVFSVGLLVAGALIRRLGRKA